MKFTSHSDEPSVSLTLTRPTQSKLVTHRVVMETARSLAEASVSANTRRAYEGALRRLAFWLWEHAVPLNDESLAAYVASLAAAGHAPPSGAMVVAAVKFRARITGQSSPAGVLTAQQLAGFRREHSGRGVGQVVGISWRVADTVASIAERSDASVRGIRDAAIISVASDALLRVSEVAALRVSDVEAEVRIGPRLSTPFPGGFPGIRCAWVPPSHWRPRVLQSRTCRLRADGSPRQCLVIILVGNWRPAMRSPASVTASSSKFEN